MFEAKGPIGIVSACRKLFGTRCTEESDIEDHICIMRTYQQELSTLKKPILRKISPMLYSYLSLNPGTTLSLLFQKMLSKIPPNSSFGCYLNSNDFASRLAPVLHWLPLTSQLPNVIPVVVLGILLVIMGNKLTERRRRRKSRTMIGRKRRRKRRRVETGEKRKKGEILKKMLLKMIWMSVMIKTSCFWPGIRLLHSPCSQMIGS